MNKIEMATIEPAPPVEFDLTGEAEWMESATHHKLLKDDMGWRAPA